jgi:hypothetical protein
MRTIRWAALGCVLVIAVMTISLSGCASYPAQMLLDPARFENDALKVEWAVGMSFYRVKLTNLTDAQIDLDLANSAIVSVDGEARALSLSAGKDATMIPPKSYIVLFSEKGAVYGTDILGRFNAETEDRYPLPMASSSDDRVFLKGHSGETLRIYLTATVRGKKTAYDIPFKIAGATRVQQAGATDTTEIQSAPAPAPAQAPAQSPPKK